MIKYIKSLCLAFVALLMFGCSSTSNKDGGNINILVLDVTSREVISGVQISLVGGSTVKTNSNGEATIGNLGAGNYHLMCEKKGYATIVNTVDLTLAADRESIIVTNRSYIYYMYKTNRSVFGEVTYTTENKVEPLKNAELQIEFSSSGVTFINKKVVTTNNEGSFTFNNCPENVTYYIYPKDFAQDNKVYSASSVNGTTSVVNNKANSINYNVSKVWSSMTVREINLDTLSATSSIQIKMSEPINTSKIDKNSILIYNNNNYNLIPSTYNFSDNNTTLTISSLSNRWPDTISLQLSLKLYSINDTTNYFSKSWIFSVTNGGSNLGNVSGIVMTRTNYSSYYDLNWNTLTNATSYEVYCKSNLDTYFNKLTETSGTYYEYYRSSSSSVTSVSFVVVGVNSTQRSNFATATIYIFNF